MIPPFDDNGYLPPGVHPAMLDEVEARFGRETEIRQAQMQSLHWLVDLARRGGMLKLLINGSFVTDVAEPNDVDCVLLYGPNWPSDPKTVAELKEGLPFIQLNMGDQTVYDYFAHVHYATDRANIPKGMVEVVL